MEFRATGSRAWANPDCGWLCLHNSDNGLQAIQYLFSVDGAQADAVHMAVAAVLAGLLYAQVTAPTEGGTLGAFGPLGTAVPTHDA